MANFVVIKKSRHILILSSWYPSRLDKYNGDFVQRHAIAISLLNKVSVIHVEGDPSIHQWEFEENQVNENMTEHIYYFPKSKFPIINFFRKIAGLRKGKKRIKDADLIHASIVHYHFIWLMFQSLPFFIAEHSTQYHRLNELPNAWLKRLLLRPIFKNAKAVLPVSRHLGKKLEDFCGKLPIYVIPNAVDTAKFYPQIKPKSGFTFLHLSNLSKAKNIQGILQSILELKNQGYHFNFHIGGNGDSKLIADFRQHNDLGDYIQVLPALSHIQVADEMRLADCFILFSNFENQPCVLAEAMACGLPFISTRVGGIHEFTIENSCYLIEKGNVSQLVDAMKKMMLNQNQINKSTLSEYADSQFSYSNISLKINKIYNDCLSGSNSK